MKRCRIRGFGRIKVGSTMVLAWGPVYSWGYCLIGVFIACF